jgi:SSS family transporter
MWKRWARALAAGLLAWGCAAAQAENLVKLTPAALPKPPVEQLDLAAAVQGHALLLAQGQAWWLDESNQWQHGPLALPAAVQAQAGDGKRLVLLFGTSPAQLAELTLTDSGPHLRTLPASPEADAVLGLQGANLVLAGRSGEHLWQLDLDSPTPAWQALTAPSAERPAGASSLARQGQAVFLSEPRGAQPEALWQWTRERGWQRRGELPGRLLAVRAIGQAHLLYVIDEAGRRNVLDVHTITGGQARLGELPAAPHYAAYGDGWLHAGADKLGTLQIESGKLLLRWLDWVVIVVYLFGVLGIGLYFYVREKRGSTDSFFVGGRSIPFWAAGVSLYAANTSSISYIAIPAKAFETNWQYMANNLIAVIGLMFVARFIVPLLRRLDLMSVFSYLETRFHPSIRMLSSAFFILTQLGSRMSVILFLPSLAIATITGIDVVWSVLMMGGFTIVYTALGGMKAVVWTDVVQLVVKMGGAVFAIVFVIMSLDGGASELVHKALAQNKTHLFDFSFDLAKATVWGFVFLVLFDVVLTFPKDQVLMQRTLSTPSAREAGRSIVTFAAIMIPGGFVFYSIGTALFVYYQAHPERLNPLLPNDATFPLFIAAELPMGVTGLIIAGIFAAAMATLSSIMNSVSTLASVDFYEKIVKQPDPAKSVRFAEWMTVLAGLLGIAAALLLSRFDVHSLFDVSIELAGLLGGGFAGAYTLGMFTRRANTGGVLVGVVSSLVLTTTAWAFNLVHPYYYLAISIMLCIVIGYAASWFFPAPKRSLAGLTIWDRVKEGAESAPLNRGSETWTPNS